MTKATDLDGTPVRVTRRDGGWPGTVGAAGHTPELPVGSVRRTLTMDGILADEAAAVARLTGLGRDVVRGRRFETIAEVGASASVALRSRLLLELDPDSAQIVPSLVGAPLSSGFRRRLIDSLPDVERGSIRTMLLEELPAAAFLALSVVAGLDPRSSEDGAPGPSPVDVCAGWAASGTLARIHTSGRAVVPDGEWAPPLAADPDPAGADAWHRVPAPPAGSFRRRRRIDVHPRVGGIAFELFFRDTAFAIDGSETVVHEYRIGGTAELDTTISTVHAIPGVLPVPECPSAADSAAWLVGYRLSDAPEVVRTRFRGTATCTHLNDALKGLSSVEPLGRLVTRSAAQRDGAA